MDHSDNNVKVRVEVEVCGTLVRKPVFTKLETSQSPTPWPSDTPVTTISGVKYIASNGNLAMGGKAAVVVRAQAYPDPNLDSTLAQYKEPPQGAAHDIPLANGAWSFTQAKNNLVPGAACDAIPGSTGGGNNSTLLVWYSFLGLDYWVLETTRFHGYCPPGSGAGMGSGSGTGAFFARPTALHATFTGSLAQLGSVALAWNGSFWVGMTPSLGGVLLAFLYAGPQSTLLSAGPGTEFSVTASPASVKPFVWSGSGAALGSGSGPFHVTLTE